MLIPLPPEYPTGIVNVSVWLDLLYSSLPKRYQDGYAAAWQMLMKGVLGDTIQQAATDALLLPLVDHPNSPSDVLKFIATENGILRYAGESEVSWKERITKFWEFTPTFGTSQGLIDLLSLFGLGTVTIENNIPGAPLGVPAPKLSPERDIPPYQSSNEWYSEFIVVFNLTSSPNGSGLFTESDLVSDVLLTSIRSFIQFYKPVDWVCREIVFSFSDPSLDMIRYDQPGINWDDEVGPHQYFYLDEDNLPPASQFGYERHVCDLNLL